jgi:hypothetical protein
MNCKSLCRFLAALAGVLAFNLGLHAQVAVPGTFKHITIDGSFDDWSGVPIAYTAVDGSTNAIQYEDLYVANDENNLYLRFTLYAPRPNAFQNSYDNLFIDADDNSSTGFPVGGIGSSMLIQWGGGYQEKNGGFNEGVINNLGWAIAGSADSLDFEVSISLAATYASDSTLVFTNDTIAILFEGDNTSYNNVEFAPPSGGLVYPFAANPGTLTTNLPLITLTTNYWEFNESETDLGTNWLAQSYDDTQPGWGSGPGLFGYTPSPGAYPTINTALTNGPTTYYFRTHFNWTNDAANIAFVVTNYISDGAVFYLNGLELTRIRMPGGAISYATPATGTNSPVGHAGIFGINGSTLQSGDNILEVEAHQAAASSADMVFGLSLTAETKYPVYNVETNLPADQTILAGQSTTFTSDIIGSGPLAYQWYFNTTNAIAGANGSSYTIPVVLTNNAGTYTLVVTNSLSSMTTRAALLTVSNIPVSIITQPAYTVAVEGRSATLSVVVSGTPLIAYQWFYNSAAITGATTASYTIAPLALANSGSYYVKVSNPAGTTNSSMAMLTVLLDTIPPAITNVVAGSMDVIITFSEPVDPVTAANAANYTISGGISVTAATPNPSDPTQVTLTTGSAMSIGTIYTLTVNGADDLFGNPAKTTVFFTRDITIDGLFGDWTGLAPIYTTTAPSGNTDAADFEDIYVYNDADYYYFRVTLWTDIDSSAGQFPYYVNMFFDTDNNPATGYSAIGSDMLIQSGYSYQEKNGNFNDGVSINGLNWLCLPAAPGTNFEFRMSRSATFQDTTPVFTTNAFQFLFQGMTPGFIVENTAPAGGGTLGYTNMTPVSVPPLPLGKISISSLPSGNAAIAWDLPGTLQFCTNLANPSWTTLPAATSPYVAPVSGKSQFFRLIQ